MSRWWRRVTGQSLFDVERRWPVMRYSQSPVSQMEAPRPRAAAAAGRDEWRGCSATSCLLTWTAGVRLRVLVARQHTVREMNCTRRRAATRKHAGLPTRSVGLTRWTQSRQHTFILSTLLTASHLLLRPFGYRQWQHFQSSNDHWQICVHYVGRVLW